MSCKETIKKKKKFIGKELSSKESNALIFNNLTITEDCGTRDQALMTLRNVRKIFSSEVTDSGLKTKFTKAWKGNKTHGLVDNSYSDIQIKLKHVDFARINCALLNPDKEFKDLTSDAATNRYCERFIKLNIEYDNLDQEAVKTKLSSIKVASVDIEFVLNKLNLFKLIQENNNFFVLVQFFDAIIATAPFR